MSNSPENKKAAFQRFWKNNNVNLLSGLVITLILCVVVGRIGLLFSLWIWLLLGAVFWALRMLLLFWLFLRDEAREQKKEEH